VQRRVCAVALATDASIDCMCVYVTVVVTDSLNAA